MPRARAACSSSPTATSTSTSRWCGSRSTAPRRAISASTCSRSAATLATLLGGNYVNRFNLEGRSYQVIPQVPRGMRLSPESLGGYYVPTNTGQLVPLSTIVSIETGTDPNSLTHYNQLNSATFQAVPMPGVTVGAGGGLPRRRGQEAAGRLQPRLSRRFPPICAGRQSARDHLRLRADHHLPGAGGAVREPARSAGDHDQRSRWRSSAR